MSNILIKIGDFDIKLSRLKNNNYYIVFQDFETDMDIARKLKITFEKYIEILMSFNAFYDKEIGEYFFRNREDIIKCVEFLNEKYGMLVKLMGE